MRKNRTRQRIYDVKPWLNRFVEGLAAVAWPVEVKGYSGTKKGGVQVKMRVKLFFLQS